MPASQEPDGFVPIEVVIGEQNPPVVSEVDFTPPAEPQPAKRSHPAPAPEPHTAAHHKED